MKKQNPNPKNDLCICSEENFKTAMNLAVRYLSYRARSEYEMSVYLKKKNVSYKMIHQVVRHLKELKYLDDTVYCKQYIHSRCTCKPRSKYALTMELKNKGIDDSLIDFVLAEVDDEKMAMNAIKKKQHAWQKLDTETLEKKVMNFLRYRGFSYGICRVTLEKILNEADDGY